MALAPEIYEEWKEREYSISVNHGSRYIGVVFVENITDKAIYFEGNNGCGFWCPKSVIKVIDSKYTECGDLCNEITIEIPHWVNI